jgi:protein-disulfide isomerase
MRRSLAAFSLSLALLLPATAPAEEPFSAAEEEAIRALVRAYILEHPEIILEAIKALEARQSAAAQASRDGTIEEQWAALAEAPGSPVLGNPSGDVTVIEFFDYNCGYCRRMTKDIFELVEDDGNIRFVLKELPIFGEGSRFAAKAALAAARQGRYGEYHYALMTADQKIDEATAVAIAAKIGLDVAQLKVDMLDPALDAELDQNFALADALKIEGTPAMLIGRQFVPGARGLDDLEQFVEAARQKSN